MRMHLLSRSSALLVTAGAILGAVVGAMLMRQYSVREREELERNVESLSEVNDREQELRKLQEEELNRRKCVQTSDDSASDSGTRRPVEFIDLSDPSHPARQICECDNMNRCRCY